MAQITAWNCSGRCGLSVWDMTISGTKKDKKKKTKNVKVKKVEEKRKG